MSENGLRTTLRDALSPKNLVPGVMANAAWSLIQKIGDGLSVPAAVSYLHETGCDPKSLIAVLGAAAIFGIGTESGRKCMEQWANQIRDFTSVPDATELLHGDISAAAEKRFAEWLVELPEELSNLRILAEDTNEAIHKLAEKFDAHLEHSRGNGSVGNPLRTSEFRSLARRLREMIKRSPQPSDGDAVRETNSICTQAVRLYLKRANDLTKGFDLSNVPVIGDGDFHQDDASFCNCWYLSDPSILKSLIRQFPEQIPANPAVEVVRRIPRLYVDPSTSGMQTVFHQIGDQERREAPIHLWRERAENYAIAMDLLAELEEATMCASPIPSRRKALIEYLAQSNEHGIAVSDLPIELRDIDLLVVCDADEFIEFGTRNHCFVGETLHVENGWTFHSVTGPNCKPMSQFVAETLRYDGDPRIRIHVRLTHKGRVEASRSKLK